MATAKEDTGEASKKTSLYSKVLEALGTNTASKGMSLQAIKKYVVDNYPETQENFSNKRLQTAMTKGLDSTEIIRPKSSTEQGMKGYFLLNRTLTAKKGKKKPKESADEDSENPKKSKVTKNDTGKAEKPKKATVAKTKAAASKTPTDSDVSKVTKRAPKKAIKRPLTPMSMTNVSSSSSMTPKARDATFTATPKVSRAERAGKISKTKAMQKFK